MAIKRSVQLFGDDAANGTRAHIDESAPATVPGYGVNNRAVGFGEVLTSGVYNRTVYALALNEDELDDRLLAFETGGLDGVYRLGAAAVPGGGRIVHADGGAVESQPKHTAQFSSDPLNAAFRANAAAATQPGAAGYDFLAHGQPAAYGFIDRRSLVLSSARTLVPSEATGVVNYDSIGPDFLSIDSPNFFGVDEETDLLTLVDLVQITAGAYAGIYRIAQVINENTVQLLKPDGSAPSFAAAIAVTIRLFRPSFASSSGVAIASLPGSGATALMLAAGSAWDATYALRTAVHGAGLGAGSQHWSGSINALGGFESDNLSGLDPDALHAADFDGAGYRFRSLVGRGPIAAGFVAHDLDPTTPFYGLLVQSRSTTWAPGSFEDGTNRINTTTGRAYLSGAVGALVEVVSAEVVSGHFVMGASLGHFAVARVQNGVDPDTLIFDLRTLDGGTPTFSTGLLAVYLLEGLEVGRGVGQLLMDSGPGGSGAVTGRATARITGAVDNLVTPSDDTPVALHVAGQSARTDSVLLLATNRNGGMKFQVNANGVVSAAAKLSAPEVDTAALKATASVLSPFYGYPAGKDFSSVVPLSVVRLVVPYGVTNTDNWTYANINGGFLKGGLSGIVQIDLQPYIPLTPQFENLVLRGVEMRCTRMIDSAGSGDGIALRLFTRVWDTLGVGDPLDVQISTVVHGSDTAGIELVTIVPIDVDLAYVDGSPTVASCAPLMLRITASANGNTAVTGDQIYGIRLHFTAFGPF